MRVDLRLNFPRSSEGSRGAGRQVRKNFSADKGKVMHAKHADEPSALTDLWAEASKAAMALRAFVLTPANIRLPTGRKIDVR
jgi:hypothetical protein